MKLMGGHFESIGKRPFSWRMEGKAGKAGRKEETKEGKGRRKGREERREEGTNETKEGRTGKKEGSVPPALFPSHVSPLPSLLPPFPLCVLPIYLPTYLSTYLPTYNGEEGETSKVK